MSSWLAVAVFACTWNCICAQAQAKNNIIEHKLGEYGWQPPEPLHQHELDAVDRDSIAIDHEGRILVGFPVRERSGLVTRELPALSYHIVRLTPQGKADLSLAIPTNGWHSNGLYLNDTDRIIVRANDLIQTLADDADTHTPADVWKTIVPCGLWSQLKQSSSRRTLFLETGDAGLPVIVVDASKLAVRKRCSKPGYSPQSITDRFAYFSGETSQLVPFDYRWPLCDYGDHVELSLKATGAVHALNDELLATVGSYNRRWSVQVLSAADGRIMFREQMAKHDVPVNLVRSSELGDRFAIDVWTVRGAVAALDISGRRVAHRIVVYSSQSGHHLAEIPVDPVVHYGFDFTLSPDGHRLAVVVDGIVTVAEIP